MPAGPLAPFLKLFEQRQLVQQQEEHQQLLQHIQRHHEELARERALREREKQQDQQEEEEETGAEADGAPKDRRMQQKQQQSHAGPHPAIGRNSSRNSSSSSSSSGASSGGNRDSGRGSPQQPRKLQELQQVLQRIPVKPLWWGRGDWVYREVRLCQVLGPYFYRQLLKVRAEEEKRTSQGERRQDVLDIRGEPFEDLTSQWPFYACMHACMHTCFGKYAASFFVFSLAESPCRCILSFLHLRDSAV